MSRRVFLHVGLPKSGTSYVQRTLSGNKRRLEDAGLLFPGAAWVEQVRAAQDVRRMAVAPEVRGQVRGAWRRLVDEVAAWPGDAVVSMEWLGAASAEQARTMVDDLGPARVNVVLTARDLGRTVPAAWQEFVQNRQEWSWQEFLEGVVAEDRRASTPGARFWAQQDLSALLDTWTGVVPATDVSVVTLPRPGAPKELLWQRMCEVLGGDYVDVRLGKGANTSLGMESAELMRRLNRHAREAGLTTAAYQRAFKHGLAKGVLARHSDLETRLVLPAAYHDWAVREAARQIKAVEASGVTVVGDLQELEPVLDATPAPQPGEVSTADLLDLCLGAMVRKARSDAADRGGRAEQARLRQRVEELEARPGRTAARLLARRARSRLAGLRRRAGRRG